MTEQQNNWEDLIGQVHLSHERDLVGIPADRMCTKAYWSCEDQWVYVITPTVIASGAVYVTVCKFDYLPL